MRRLCEKFLLFRNFLGRKGKTEDEQASSLAIHVVSKSIRANKVLLLTSLMITVVEAIAAALIEIFRGVLVENQTSAKIIALTSVVMVQHWLMLAFYATLGPLIASMNQDLFMKVFDAVSKASPNALAKFHRRFGPTTSLLVTTISRAFARDFPTIFNGVIIVLGQLIVISWVFGLKYLGIAILGIVFVFGLTPIQVQVDRKLSIKQKEIDNRINSHFNETVQSIFLHQEMDTLGVERKKLERLHKQSIRLQVKYLIPKVLTAGINRLLPAFITISWGLFEVKHDGLSAGFLVMLYGLLNTVLQVVYSSLQIYRNLKGTSQGDLVHYGHAISLPERPKGTKEVGGSTAVFLPRSLRVKQGEAETFTFPQGLVAECVKVYSHQPLVRIVSEGIYVEPGATLAIIGKSGSGKTTILRLLTGGLTSGELLGGQVQYRLSDGSWGKTSEIDALNWSVVQIPQNAAELWTKGTVGDNLKLPFRTLEDNPRKKKIVFDALRLAELPLPADGDIESAVHSIVRKALKVVGLPEAKLGQIGVSGGERTRAVVARAVVRMYLIIAAKQRSPIMVADEVTSNLDPETKREMMEGLVQETRRLGVTFVFTSHDEIIIPGEAIGLVLGPVAENAFSIKAVGSVELLRKLDSTYRRIYGITS